jgi:hypothetical protein
VLVWAGALSVARVRNLTCVIVLASGVVGQKRSAYNIFGFPVGGTESHQRVLFFQPPNRIVPFFVVVIAIVRFGLLLP